MTAAVVLQPLSNQSNFEGDTVSLAVSASDAQGRPLTFSATGLPTGLTINPSSGLIAGTIAASAAQALPYTVSVTASDGSHMPARRSSRPCSPW